MERTPCFRRGSEGCAEGHGNRHGCRRPQPGLTGPTAGGSAGCGEGLALLEPQGGLRFFDNEVDTREEERRVACGVGARSLQTGDLDSIQL